MKWTQGLILTAAVALLGLWWLAGWGASGWQQKTSRNAAAQQKPAPTAKEIPPYYKSEQEAKPFPRLVSPEAFRGYPVVVRAYEIAGRMPGVLAQQPCYCWCSKSVGHKSLVDCYASDHGAG